MDLRRSESVILGDSFVTLTDEEYLHLFSKVELDAPLSDYELNTDFHYDGEFFFIVTRKGRNYIVYKDE